MRSHLLLVVALVARSLAEPIPAKNDEETSKKKDPEHTAATDVTASSTPVVVVTIGKEALTTTFTPPATCTQSRLTQLASPGYQIWLHEPMPVGGSTVGDCFPSQFMQGYTSIANASSSIVPVISPLVCPQGWTTAQKWDKGYIACCASGYQFHPAESLVDPNRPAYGGTCYSDFTIGQTTTVTAYDNVKATATAHWKASRTGDQAYGHVIDGFALDLIAKATTAPSTSGTQSLPAETIALADSSGKSGLSGGAITGIVIGCLAGITLIFAGAFFFVRRRRQQQQHELISSSRDQPSQVEDNDEYIDKSHPDAYALKTNPVDGSLYSKSAPGHAATDGRSKVTGTASPPATVISPVSKLGGQMRHELGSTEYVELDAGNRHEM